ncbi:MAG: class E sortase [Actinomycetota bacterium]|nr:class E sortase [Actinomycetota bacterium]
MSGGDDRDRFRRWTSRLGLLLIVAGVLSLVEVGLTVFWQEPFSSFTAKGRQDRVRDEVERLVAAPLAAADARVLARLDGDSRSAFSAARLRRSARTGKGIGRIEIPKIDVDTAFVQGTDGKTLQRGPGHYPRTDLPGEDGTVGIAGHRTTYGAPFRRIDALERGDRIEVTMPYGRFSYEVERLAVVTPDKTEVVRDVGRPRLVLSACTPLFSSARRIIVFARQVTTEGSSVAARPDRPTERSGRPPGGAPSAGSADDRAPRPAADVLPGT